LARFLGEVERADARIRAASALVNADAVGGGMRIRPSTRAAISALDLTSVAGSLPAGAGEALTRRSPLVYSELSSRRAALRGLVLRTPAADGTVTLSPGDEALTRVRECLANGARAYARFGPDVAALRTLAATSASFAAAAPASHAAAEIAVRTRYIDGWNGCCDACGGYVTDRLVPIVWRDREDPVAGHTDGTVDGVAFEASYRGGSGWTVVVHAG
jgi:hypothetical protein